MQALRTWSFVKLLMVSGGWILVCLLAAVAWFLFQFRDLLTASSSGSGGIGAVSFGVSGLALLIPFGPPIALVAAWLIARAF
jgi:hypothetical protein